MAKNTPEDEILKKTIEAKFAEKERSDAAKQTARELDKQISKLSDVANHYQRIYGLGKANIENQLAEAKAQKQANDQVLKRYNWLRQIAADERKSLEERAEAEAELKQNRDAFRAAQRASNSLQEDYGRLLNAQRLYDQKNLSNQEKLNKKLEQRKKYKQDMAEIDAKLQAGLYADNPEQYEADKAKAEEDAQGSELGGGDLLTSLTQSGGLENLVGTMGGPIGKIAEVVIKIAKVVDGMASAINDSLLAGVSEVNKYLGKMDSRLYGDENNSFYNILENILSQTTMNPFFTQEDLLKNISTVVEKGIDFNIEQRALLVTLQDKLVSTFDALDQELLRLIRLQQYDSTEAFLGSESILTMFLNNLFKDTSYLSDMYDTVYDAIIDSMADMNVDQATQFNYNVQKWLASLYAVGLSQEAVSNIADAINKLATGDVSSLSGSAQQTLLALTSTKSGQSYADMLTQGLDASDVNDLMKSMVEYLRDIANNTTSNVTKSQWSNLLGLTMSDWAAVKNLSDEDIAAISNSNVTAQSALDETSKLMTQMVNQRTHLSEKIENLVENAKYQFSMTLAEDEALYTTYMVGKIASDVTDSLGLSAVGDIINFFTNLTEMIQVAEKVWDMAGDVSDVLGQFLTGGWESVAVRTIQNVDGTFSYVMSRGNTSDATTDTSGNVTNISSSASITESRYNSQNSYSDDYTEVETSTEDSKVTSLSQNEEAVSATTTNIASGETITTRDINSLYAALFEDNLAVHVFLDDMSSAVETKLTSSNNSSGIISAVNGIRKA